jgi:hypothetical protein
MRTIIILILFTFQTDNIVSPDGNYEIIQLGRELGDANAELIYHILDNRTKDTTFTTLSVIHDFLPPAFWWTSDSKNLIFEQRNVLDTLTPSIKVFNFESDSIVFTTRGFMNIRQNTNKIHFDDINNKLIYFTASRHNYQLNILDITSLKSSLIMDFIHNDDYETPTVLSYEYESGDIEIKVKNENSNLVTLNAKIK